MWPIWFVADIDVIRAFQLPDPYPYVPMMLIRTRLYPTRAENCYPTRPDRRVYPTRTRSLPVGLPFIS